MYNYKILLKTKEHNNEIWQMYILSSFLKNSQDYNNSITFILSIQLKKFLF